MGIFPDVVHVFRSMRCSAIAVWAFVLGVSSFANRVEAQPDTRAHAHSVPVELEPIASQVRQGEVRNALELLRALPEPARSAPATRYLEGRLAEQLNELDSSIDAFANAVPPLAAELVRDAMVRRARHLARRGRCAEAEPLLDGLLQARASHPAESALEASARALRGECALARGNFTEAESMLAAAAREDARDVDSFALRFMLAEAQLRGGSRDRAIATLRELVVMRPEHPDAERAEATLADLTGTPVVFTLEERLDRAERMSEALLHEQAIATLQSVLRPRDRRLAARLLHVRGMALFRSRHAYREAATALEAASALGGTTAHADAFHAARALSRAGNDAGAIRAYRQLVRRAPESSEAAEAEYLAAWLELRLGRRSGQAAMERFVRGPRARRTPALAREAEWQLALQAFRRGAYPRAAELFAAYADRDRGALVRGRGIYWRGRALAEAGQRDRAVAAYRTVIHVSPLHWYALLARQRLVELGEEPGPPFANAARDEQDSPSEITLPDDVTTLLALGLHSDARRFVRQRERDLRARFDLRAMVELYEHIGDHERAYQLSAEQDELSRPALRGEVWAWRAAYPRAFEEAVVPAARAQSTTPELLWAIMRQESAYDPNAVSYADAIGLLQMLPSTATTIARRLGVTFERGMLFDPAWNTRLAAAYVSQLAERLGVPLCFAAFNAGEPRVSEWLERHGEIELDLFVEEIPFDQTRNYIRRVTSHLAHYMYLRDPGAGWPALDLPRRVGPAHPRSTEAIRPRVPSR